MSKHAYCCITTKLINYVKASQSWEAMAVIMGINSLSPIEQQIYSEYVQLEQLKRQIINNQEINIDNFKKLVSTDISIIELCKFYNSNLAGKFSEYYTYCEITPPSDEITPPVIPPPNNDPFINPDNHDLQFKDISGHFNDIINSNVVIIGNLPAETDVVLWEGSTTLFSYKARCAQIMTDLEIADFKEITNNIKITGKTSVVGTLLVQLQSQFIKENIGLDEFILVIDNQSKIWNVSDTKNDISDTKFKDLYNVKINTYQASNIIMVSGFAPNSSIKVSCDGVADGLIAAFAALGGDNNTILKKSINVNTNAYGDIYIQSVMYSANNVNIKKSLNVYINDQLYDIWNVATVGFEYKFEFAFPDYIQADLNTICNSNTITVEGIEANKTIVVSSINGKIDAGSSNLSGGFSTIRTVKTTPLGTIVIAAQGKSSNLNNTATTVTITIDNVVGHFNIITK